MSSNDRNQAADSGGSTATGTGRGPATGRETSGSRPDDHTGETPRRERSPGSRVRGLAAVRGQRAQTTIDFGVGIGIFLISMAFIFAFVPGMLAPFTGGTQAETPAVNRVADDLTQGRLGDPADPYVLDPTCTEAFFESGAPPSECRFGSGTTGERVGLDRMTSINVTILGDLDASGPDRVLCIDGGTLYERGSGSCTSRTTLSRGSRPSGSGGKTVTATRVASLAGEDVTVEVVMW